MGIKSLTQTIKKYSPDTIKNENLYKLTGKRVAVDASLVIYQQLHKGPKGKLFTNSKGKITNHITGLFYKIMNYVSLNIQLIFVFDGKPPENKKLCIDERKEKSKKALEQAEMCKDEEEKLKLKKASLRITNDMINDVKNLLNLLGIPYIHPDGEAEAYASELCRIGYVDYVLTEDMDTMGYGCPRVIRNCVDRELKRKDIVSIFTYEQLINDLELTHDKFIEFCVLCGCDYCPSVPKIGNITALKLIKKYNTMDEIVEKSNYEFPDKYLDIFQAAKENYFIFRDKINPKEIKIECPEKDIGKLKEYLVNDIEMSDKRVQNALKKFHNNYK